MNTEQLVDDQSFCMVHHCFRAMDRHGRDVVAVVAKVAYRAAPDGLLSFTRPPLRGRDERPREDIRVSVRYPSDLTDEKPGTDVLLIATAYPQAAGTVTHQDVSLRVGDGRRELFKIVRVHGPRVWQRGLIGAAPGPAAPLAPTPIVYELAYGGVDDSDPDRTIVERRNPAGRGVADNRARLIDQPAPQIEDLEAPLSSSDPRPAGFGPIAPEWEPRASFSGTRDETWARERAPVAPEDFNPRFHCSAPPGLWSEQPLDEDVQVQVLGATPEGRWAFRLPRYAPTFSAVIRGTLHDCPTHLDTILIDSEARRVELSWRASVVMPRRESFLERIILSSDPSRVPEDILLRLIEAARALEGAPAEVQA